MKGRVVSTQRAIARAQTLLRHYIPKGRSLSEELIRQRRGEPSRPFREYLAEKHLMTEGYKAMAREQKQLAEMAAKVVPEVLPEWK